MEIVSIYDYFLAESLEHLSRLPLENQLKECLGLRILVLDFCGTVSKYLYKFGECDVFVVKNTSEDVFKLLNDYDVVYAATTELQSVALPKPYLRIVCRFDRMHRVEAIRGILSDSVLYDSEQSLIDHF